jgi:hypothetical protein
MHVVEEGRDEESREGGEARQTPSGKGKRSLRRAVRLCLLTGECRWKGHRIGMGQLPRVAQKELIQEVHQAMGERSRGHEQLRWLRKPKKNEGNSRRWKIKKRRTRRRLPSWD